MPVPDFSVGEVFTASAADSIGLWRITTCTVTSVGGTAATVSNGTVTIGNGNTSVTVSSAFSSDFTNYRIIISQVDLSSNSEALRLTLSGVSGSVYKTNIQYASWGATALTATGSGGVATGFMLGFGGTSDDTFIVSDISGPQTNKATLCTSHSASNAYFTMSAGICTSTTQSTGFTLAVDNGSMTGGTLRLYGYRN